MKGLGWTAGALLSASLLSSRDARANPPLYDVVAYCTQVANSVGGSQEILGKCEQQEQQSHNALKPGWETIPEKTRNYCDQVVRSVGSSYQILASCIRQERAAAQQYGNFTFQQ